MIAGLKNSSPLIMNGQLYERQGSLALNQLLVMLNYPFMHERVITILETKKYRLLWEI